MKSPSKSQIEGASEEHFHNKLDAWTSALVKNRLVPFGELLRALPGVFPSDVVASIRRLDKAGILPLGYRAMLVRSVRTRFADLAGVELPEFKNECLEHPLDFEWLFTKDANLTISQRLRQILAPGQGTILCLGCPSFYAFATTVLPEYQLSLCDKNATHVGQLSEVGRIAEIDLTREPIPTQTAEAAVIDPPWYNDFYKLFIWGALERVKLGGSMLISFPPEGTRPSAANDLKEVLRWCQNAGAELIEHRPGILPYRSPLFEINALAMHEIHNVPWDWRRGDLLVLKKSSDAQLPCPIIPNLGHHWHEFKIGLVRVKVRFGKDSQGDAGLRPVAGTPVLPSVSTHYPGRENANVVTTGNRFLYTCAPNIVKGVFEEMSLKNRDAFKNKAVAAPDQDGSAKLKAQIENLLEQETREAIHYLTKIHGQ